MATTQMAAQPAGPASKPSQQLEEYAFNPCGWAMKVPPGNWNDSVVVLNAYPPSNIPWERAAERAASRGQPAFRYSLELTPREISCESDVTVSKYVVVGFTWPGLPSMKAQNGRHPIRHPNLPNGQPVGQMLIPGAEVARPASCPSPVPVPIVARIVSGRSIEQGSCALYALMCPSSALLCQPHPISCYVCFYLARYRDDTVSLRNRPISWNKKVREVCNILPSVEDNAGLDDGTPEAEDMTQEVVIKEEEEFDWTNDDSVRLLEELREWWPERFDNSHQSVKDEVITADRLTLVKWALVKHNLELEADQLRQFLEMVCFDLKVEEEGDGAFALASNGGRNTYVAGIVRKALNRTGHLFASGAANIAQTD